MKKENPEKKSIATEFDALTDEQLEAVLGGLNGRKDSAEAPKSANAQSALVLTAKTVGIPNQIAGFTISIVNEKGDKTN